MLILKKITIAVNCSRGRQHPFSFLLPQVDVCPQAVGGEPLGVEGRLLQQLEHIVGRVGVSRQRKEEVQQGGQLQGKPGMMSL